MSSLSTDVYQEGVRIPPVKLTSRGKVNQDVMQLILSNVRTPMERKGDLRAQEAANKTCERRFAELARRFGGATLFSSMAQLIEYSRNLMRREMRRLPHGTVQAVDYLDSDGFETQQIPIKLKLTVDQSRIVFDFSGSSAQVKGPVNAVYSITLSAVYYVVRCITDPSIPANEGCFEHVKIIAPPGTIVNAQPPAPVAGGNVETSTRIVDVSLRAFSQLVPERVCAACQGTMNNLTIGGVDPRTGQYFTYYETIAGGFGARHSKDGIDGIHSHLTNTLNTPVEALESSFPFRITKYELAMNSGGRGKFRGGLGIRRDLEIAGHDATVSLLGERQAIRPWGLQGGKSGSPGKYSLQRRNRVEELLSKCTVNASQGDILSIVTPGGGGFGPVSQRDPESMKLDVMEEKA